MCHFSNSDFKGNYTKVESHLLGKAGTGVRVFQRMTLQQIG